MKHKGLFWGIMGVSIVVGGVLVVLGMAMGGQLGNTNDIWGRSKHGNKNTVLVDGNSVRADGTGSDFMNIRNLDFSLAAGDVTIKEGDSFSVSGSSINSYVSDDGKTWHLESPKPRKWYSWLYRHGGEWEITLPRNYSPFDTVTLNFAAADVDIESISAEHLTIAGAAGEADIQHMIASKSLDLTIGAGSLEVEAGELNGESYLKCGAGSIEMALSQLKGTMNGDCGMGTIDLTLPGTREQYNIASQAGMGEVRIEHGKDNHSHQTGEGILAELDLTCGMGEIKVNFDD